MKFSILRFSLLCLLSISFYTNLSGQCVPADCADSEVVASLAATEIVVPTIPLTTIDFEAMTTGPTTVGEINAAYSGTFLGGIESTTRIADGFYNYNLGGNALGLDVNGQLAILAESADFTSTDSMTISLPASTTEIGIHIADWGGTFNVNLYDSGTKVGMVNYSSAGAMVYIQSDVNFDSFVLTTLPEYALGNWVIAGLALPAAPVAVPTISQWGVIILLLMFLVTGLVSVKQRLSILGTAK